MLNLKELSQIEKLEAQLNKAAVSNYNKNKYYYQKNRIKDLGINTPDSLKGLQILLGWSKMAVDVIAERINWKGYYNPETGNQELTDITEWLNKLYRDNYFESEQKLAQKDALITGTGFISVGAGDEDNGEPPIIWIAENSSTITVNYNRRTREVASGFKIIKGQNGEVDEGILWLPDATVEVYRKGDKWEEVSRDDHEAGIVGVVPIFNNSDSKYIFGRSEISRALRQQTDAAMRTLVNAEVNREHYARPYRYMVGVDMEDMGIIDKHGNKTLRTAAGDIIYLPHKAGEEVKSDIKELSGNSPMAVMEMIEPFARIAAREIGVPPSYMGFDSVNPSSAEAINAAESALTHRADDRVTQLKRTYKRLANVSMVFAGKNKPEGWNAIDTIFDRTETLSPSAAADRASKLNAIGLFERSLPDYVYREVGLSEAEIVELKAHLRTVANTNIIDRLAEDSTPVIEGEVVNG